MNYTFKNEIWYWRGPAPFYFVSIPEPISEEIREFSSDLSYGWGVIPVNVTIGETTFSTAMFPKDGCYAVPIRKAVRDTEELELGDVIEVSVEVGI